MNINRLERLPGTRHATLLAIALLVAACGNNDTAAPLPPPPSAATYDLDTAFRDLHRQGSVAALRGEGDCLGTWVRVQRPPEAGTGLDQQPAQVAATTDTRLLAPSCPIASGIEAGEAFFDAGYAPTGYTGSSAVGVVTEAFSLPGSARDGDQGQAGVITRYVDASLRQPLGEIRIGYRVAAGARAGEAIVEITRETVGAAGSPGSVLRERYRLDAEGRLMIESAELEGVWFGR